MNSVAPDTGKSDESSLPSRVLPLDQIQEGGINEILDKDTFEAATWIPPSKSRISHKSRYLNGKAPFFATTLDDLGTMGVGIMLYFQMIRNLCILFLVCSIVAVPSIMLNAGGDGIANQDADSAQLVYLSLGNRRADDCTIADNMMVDLSSCKLEKSLIKLDSIGYEQEWASEDVAYTIMSLDLVYSAIFVIFIVFMTTSIDNVVAEVDEDNVSAADYAVLVRGFPKSATEEQIRQFFSDRYDLTKCSSRYYPLFCGCFGKERHRKVKTSAVLPEGAPAAGAGSTVLVEAPVQELEYCDGDSTYKESWVAEVSVAHPNGAQISKYLLQSKTYHKLREARARVQKYSDGTPWKKGADETKRQKALANLAKLEKKMEEAAAKLDKKHHDKAKETDAGLQACECAFVMFENEKSLNLCKNDYRTSHSSINRFFQPKSLRFPEQTASGVKLHPLWVRPAPEPSVILWENLEITGMEYQLRCILTNFLTFVIICVACGSIMMAKKYQNDYQSAIPAATECSDALVGCGWTSFTLSELDSCTTTIYSEYVRDRALKCFCKEQLGVYVNEFGALTGTEELGKSIPECKQYADNAYTSMALTVVAAFVVVALNIALQTVLKALTEVERHDSLSDESASVSFKIFLATFLNTALILLLVNAQFVDGNGDSYLPDGFPLFSGSFTDLSRGWYSVVGAGLSLTMALNVFSPHLAPMVQCLVVQPITRLLFTKSAATQHTLDSLHTGPQFLLHVRYPVILNTVCTTLIYSGGMPMLLPFALIFCVICYLLDKALLLYMYQRPPNYDASLAYTMLSILPWALCAHLGFSVWFYSNPNLVFSTVVNSGTHNSDGFVAQIFSKGLRSTTLPLFLFAIGVLAFLVYNLFVASFLHGLGVFESTTITGQFHEALTWMRTLYSGKKIRADQIVLEAVPPYSKTFEQPIRCQVTGTADKAAGKGGEGSEGSESGAAEANAPLAPPELTSAQEKLGMKLVKKQGGDGTGADADKPVFVMHRFYTEDATAEATSKQAANSDGVNLKLRMKGAQMQTWEAIQGLHSYRIMSNERYRAALQMLVELKERASEQADAAPVEEGAPDLEVIDISAREAASPSANGGGSAEGAAANVLPPS
jgi:hypothetical protein